MAQVQSLKCPNCGANITGQGSMKCPYCNSQLHISGDGLTQPTQVVMVDGTSTHEGTTAYFKNLPGVPVTIRTENVPFQPLVVYDRLPGGRVDPMLESEARAIANMIQTMQRAMNQEDLSLYETVVSHANPTFFEQARKGAEQTFVLNDAKRYTTKISFTSLSRDAAVADVSNETVSFPVGGAVQNVEMTFRYSMKKEHGTWKIVVSSLIGAGGATIGSGGRGGKIVALAIAVAILIGIGGAVTGILGESGMSIEGTILEIQETFDPPDNAIVNGEYMRGVGRVCEVGDTLFIWSEPSENSQFLGAISSPEQVKVLYVRDDNWTKIQIEPGNTSIPPLPGGEIPTVVWTPAKIWGEEISGAFVEE
ncbi:MAG: zinc ribbon domain-containing protein [bacterium]|nr:zinc ribbon domain-containing protein [bacterium]